MTLSFLVAFIAAAAAPASGATVLHIRTSDPSPVDLSTLHDRARPSLTDGLASGAFARAGRGGDHDAVSETKIRHNLAVRAGARAQTAVHASFSARAHRAATRTSTPASAGTAFAGLIDNISYIPPDTNGAVGPNHVIETLNSQVQIWSRSGAPVAGYPMDLATFWAGFGSSFTDPRVVYDPYANRWISVVDADFGAAHSKLDIAVSDSSDPTQTWKRWSIDTDPSGNDWCDYPTLGFNKDWIVSTCNMFGVNSGISTNSRVFVFHKTNLYAGTADTPTVTVMPATDGFTMQPTVTYDSTLATEYLLQSWNGNSGGKGFVALYTIGASQTPSGPAKIGTASTWDATPGTADDFAPQSGTAALVSTGDDRMIDAVYRNGSIWGAQTVFVSTGSDARSDVQWWQVSPSASLQAFGRLDATAKYYGYPSISVNRNGDAMIGFSTFSSTQHPSSGYVFRHSDGTFDAEQVLKAGVDSYHKTYGGSSNRWGDYSSTQVDPANDTDFWTLQEYAETHTNDALSCTPDPRCDRWGTYWGQVLVPSSSAQIQLSSSSLGFGDQRVGTTSGAQTVTVTNTGSAILGISSVARAGADPNDFATSGESCSAANLAPGATCTIPVTFTPSVTGARSAAIQISSNAPNSPWTVSLSGNGTPVGAAISISPSPLDFGEQSIALSSSAKTISIKNVSTASVAVSAITLTGTNGADFTLSNDFCSGRSVAASATCTVQAIFTPSGAGVRQATLQVAHNGAGSPATSLLEGTGIAPVVELAPAALSFPVTKTGKTASAQTITVGNSGRGTLADMSVQIDGLNPSEFQMTANTCTAATYTTGQSCTVSIRFAPTGNGARSARLSIVSNAPGAPVTAALNGTADGAPPVSAFRTASDQILIGGSSTIDGNVRDDLSGVAGATLQLTSTLGGVQTYSLALQCDLARTLCTWSFIAPVTPGSYTANTKGIDEVGNAESPGPSISLLIL